MIGSSQMASDAWLVLSPAPAGRFNGIGDYAARLAAALGSFAATDLLVTGEGDWPALADVGAVFHQYSPAAPYGALWRDENRWLDRVARAGRPVVVTIHEYWPPANGSLKRALYRAYLRRRIRRVAARATAVLVTQELSVGRLRAAGILPARCPVHVVPVGSNVTPAVCAPGPRDGGLLLFGQAAHMHPAVMRAVAQWRVASGAREPLTWVSRSADEARAWWCRVAGGRAGDVRCLGGLPEAELSQLLSAATLGLAPYADGASGRRTTLAALMQHAVPTLSLQGMGTDEWLRRDGPALATDSDPAAFVPAIETLLADPDRRAALSRAARSAFETHMSWPTIADAYARALESGKGRVAAG